MDPQRTEARNLKAGMRIAAVEDVALNPPVLVEHVMTDEDFGLENYNCSVWHGSWMFGLIFDGDDVVTVEWDEELPAPPSREGMVRVHGTWHVAGEIGWAPAGYPATSPNGGPRAAGG